MNVKAKTLPVGGTVSLKNGLQQFDMVLPVILLSYFMLLLDNSIVFTGTVKIAQELGLSQAKLSWVTNAYALSFGGLLLCGGRLGDIFGRRRVFSIGLVIFGVSSLFVGMAQDAFSIIAARGAQGVGSAILAPTTLALLIDNYSGDARLRAISAYGATAGLGASLGLVIGGVFAGVFSWRHGFFINAPISAMLLLFTCKFIKERISERNGGIDYLGGLTSVAGMTALVYSLVGGAYNLYAFAAAVVLLAAFIAQEARTPQPMMPLRLFADRERLGAYVARFFYLGGMLTLWFLTPQMLQRVLGFTPLQAGLAFFPFTITNFVLALQVGKLTKRWGNTRLLAAGILITAAGMGLLALFKAETGYWLGVALPMLLLGGGQGLAFGPLTSAGVANVLPEDAGAASGTVNVVHQFGGSIGLSIVVSLTGGLSGTGHGYNSAMGAGLVFFIISLAAVMLLIYPATGPTK